MRFGRERLPASIGKTGLLEQHGLARSPGKLHGFGPRPGRRVACVQLGTVEHGVNVGRQKVAETQDEIRLVTHQRLAGRQRDVVRDLRSQAAGGEREIVGLVSFEGNALVPHQDAQGQIVLELVD